MLRRSTKGSAAAGTRIAVQTEYQPKRNAKKKSKDGVSHRVVSAANLMPRVNVSRLVIVAALATPGKFRPILGLLPLGEVPESKNSGYLSVLSPLRLPPLSLKE